MALQQAEHTPRQVRYAADANAGQLGQLTSQMMIHSCRAHARGGAGWCMRTLCTLQPPRSIKRTAPGAAEASPPRHPTRHLPHSPGSPRVATPAAGAASPASAAQEWRVGMVAWVSNNFSGQHSTLPSFLSSARSGPGPPAPPKCCKLAPARTSCSTPSLALTVSTRSSISK